MGKGHHYELVIFVFHSTQTLVNVVINLLEHFLNLFYKRDHLPEAVDDYY